MFKVFISLEPYIVAYVSEFNDSEAAWAFAVQLYCLTGERYIVREKNEVIYDTEGYLVSEEDVPSEDSIMAAVV